MVVNASCTLGSPGNSLCPCLGLTPSAAHWSGRGVWHWYLKKQKTKQPSRRNHSITTQPQSGRHSDDKGDRKAGREEARRPDLKTKCFQLSSGRGQGPQGGAGVQGEERNLWGASSGEGHRNRIVRTLYCCYYYCSSHMGGGVSWAVSEALSFELS